MPSSPADPAPPDSPHDWDRLLQSVSPPAMLVLIQGWLGPKVARWHDAEDVWQETLVQAWRDRARMPADDLRAFRRWLCGIARHRVLELLDHVSTQKRGGGRERRIADVAASETSLTSLYAGPIAETTPSQIVADRERAELLLAALGQVPEQWREVVRLRLHEDLTIDEVAARLALTGETVRYRFRVGLEIYARALLARGALSTSEREKLHAADP